MKVFCEVWLDKDKKDKYYGYILKEVYSIDFRIYEEGSYFLVKYKNTEANFPTEKLKSFEVKE